MKIKKMLMCVAAGAVVMSCASANDIDVNQIRIACQNSDKTLWVERNQICIPQNPCNGEKYSRYCNRHFADVETQGIGYMVLVDLYARAHNLSCRPVKQDAKMIGQDYVLCDGTDIMVFEFDDINDRAPNKNIGYRRRMAEAICRASGAVYNGTECLSTKDECNLAKKVLDEYGFMKHQEIEWGESVFWDEVTDTCIIFPVINGGTLEETKF